MIPGKALDVPQIQDAQLEAPVALVVGEPDQPVGNQLVLGAELCLVSIAGFADRKDVAGQPDRPPSAYQ